MSYEIRDTSRVGWHIELSEAAKAAGLILARIDRDVGSWRLFPADCPTDEIVTGVATPLLAGYSTYSTFGRKWLAPDEADIAHAVARHRERTVEASR
jgi:hypothetical protein